MDHSTLQTILADLRQGRLTTEQAAHAIQELARGPLGFATLDYLRPDRCGAAEVVYAAGKRPQQVIQIARKLLERSTCALITRADGETSELMREMFNPIIVGSRGSTLLVGSPPPAAGRPIPIVTAGTSDEAVAEEAELTCAALGRATRRINDVGVAGLHRLMEHVPALRLAPVIICIAGMEGALPSVVGGLVSAPVIAVPTSIGYGAHFTGLSALLGMLTSCAAGVVTVNIDNGFGAGYAASLISRLADPPPPEA